jgi:hypothetical protein
MPITGKGGRPVASLSFEDRAASLGTEAMVDLRRTMFEYARNVVEPMIKRDWPNPSNSGPQADDQPSESIGRSSGGWFAALEPGVRNLVVNMFNDVEYSKFVHFTGGESGPPGDAMIAAQATLDKEMPGVMPELEAVLQQHLRRIGEASV